MTTQIGYPEERPEEIEARALVAKAASLVNIAKSMKVFDNPSYEEAATFKLQIRERREAARQTRREQKEVLRGLEVLERDLQYGSEALR